MKKVVFVYNPDSGKAKRENILGELTNEAGSRSFEVVLIPFFDFLKKDYANTLKESKAVFIIGGDGTANGVINQLANSGIDFPPLVVYPGGTSNDFATLWWSGGFCSPKKAFDAVMEDNVYKVDLGKVNDRYFINVAGAGMFVDVASETSSRKKQKWGVLAYLGEGLMKFSEYRPFTIELIHNGKKEKINCYLILVLNSKGAGGLRNLVPGASMDDGLLDVLIVKELDNTNNNKIIENIDYSVFTLYPKILLGSHMQDNRVLHYQLSNFSVECVQELKLTVDGESGPDIPFNFSLKKQCVPLFYK
ncbi:MAG: diacylglycerol/lipid kinase family protein [Candidatus Nanoarchaeia archaeon]